MVESGRLCEEDDAVGRVSEDGTEVIRVTPVGRALVAPLPNISSTTVDDDDDD
jgi:hypothetical protein